MVRSQEEERCPSIVVDLEFDDGCGWLIIHNIGRTLALNLGVNFEPALLSTWGREPSSIALLAHTIAFLPPGRVIRLNLRLRQQVRIKSLKLWVRVQGL